MYQTLFWGLSSVHRIDLALPSEITGDNKSIGEKESLA